MRYTTLTYLLFKLAVITLTIPSYAQINILHHFNGTDGATSKGSLTLVGNVLYGRTSAGGASNQGVIFKINTDSTAFQVLYSFTSGSNNVTGNQPHHDNMLSVGSLLYGTALYGGNNDNGVLYKINTNGTAYSPLRTFTGSTNDGGNSHSGVIIIGSTLYGMTAKGGANGKGTIFRLDTTGVNFTILHSFHNSTGDDPHGRLSLSSDGTLLLGITRSGGSTDSGVVFSFNLSNLSYNVIHNFMGAPNDAAYSDHGFLTVSGDTLFGMTQFGGGADKGAVFSMKQDGSNFVLLHSFGIGSDGYYPYGSLALSNGFLYGTTRNGGVNDKGTVFRVNKNGSVYQLIASFNMPINGAHPIDNVVISSDGEKLYGLTQVGGINDPSGINQYGTIFSMSNLSSISVKKISSELPSEYTLSQNYPNPFNPTTKIRFDVSSNQTLSEAKGLMIKLLVYDILGREIATLVNQELQPGTYEVEWNASSRELGITSGIYYYRVVVTKTYSNSVLYTKTRKMVLSK